MVLTKWTREMTTKFISLYQEQECLWRIDSLAYRDKDARDNGLRNIIDGMNIKDLTMDDVKKKIKYLRSTYMTEIHKMYKAQSYAAATGSLRIYKPALTWFNQMDSFIKNVNIKSKRHVVHSSGSAVSTDQVLANAAITHPNIKYSDTSDTDNDEPTVYDTNKETASSSMQKAQEIVTDTKNHDKNNKTIKRSASMEADDATNEIPKTDSERPSPTISKRPRLYQLRRSIQEISAKLNKEEETNAFEIYGKYVGVQLKSMNEEDAILAQQEIQTILTRYKLKRIKHNRYTSETPSTSHSQLSDYQYLASPTDADSNTKSRRPSHYNNDTSYEHNYSGNQYNNEPNVNEPATVRTRLGVQYSDVQCNVEIVEDDTAILEVKPDVVNMAYTNV